MRNSIQLSAAKNYFLGFATSGLFLVSGLYYFNNKPDNPDTPQSFAEMVSAEKAPLQNFDPNELSEQDWVNLGFSERQVATILKYKTIVGGAFTSKEQLQKCYAISEEKYSDLEPFLLLPEKNEKTNNFANYSNYNSKNYSNSYRHSSPNYTKKSSKLHITGKFNPDHFTVNDFIKLGFTEKQSLSILKYKQFLGGSFISKEKFSECYMISEENYRKLAPFLLLPERADIRTSQNSSFSNLNKTTKKPTANYQPFDPNTTNLQGWIDLGFSEKQAHVIINYRDRNLKGSFRSLEDIAHCFVISDEKFKSLKPYIILNSENIKSIRNTAISERHQSNDLIEDFKNTEKSMSDFRKIDLNSISFRQLLEFGFDENSAASYIGFRNKLGGFTSTTQILETYNIDKELALKLVATSPLLLNNVTKYSLTDAPESWLKNHPYFKYYADKIIFYRISFSDDKKIMKEMKLKPETKAKMLAYLK